MTGVNHREVAGFLIGRSLKVREDEVVWINCGRHNLEFAEDCAVEIRRNGGFPIIEVTTDRFNKLVYDETPEKFLQKSMTRIAKLKYNIDTMIYIEAGEDPASLKDVSFERKALYRNATKPVRKVLLKNRVKTALFLYPTEQMAKSYDVSWEDYHDRVWNSVLVSPYLLYKTGKPIKEYLKGRDRIRIESGKGTDLEFSIRDRGIVICNGEELEENYQVCRYNLNIPAGEVFTTIVEDSANGTAVFDKVFIDGTPVEDLSLHFQNGTAVDFDAGKGRDVFREFFNSLGQSDRISAEFGIGINPHIRGVIGCLHTDEKIAGTIHIAIGANNMYGGRNDAAFHFDMIMPEPTVHADGNLFMDHGRIVLE